MGVSLPHPGFLDSQVSCGAPGGRKRWTNTRKDRYYEWDSLHGHVEAYNARGKHLGVLDGLTGVMVSAPVKGRTIDVK